MSDGNLGLKNDEIMRQDLFPNMLNAISAKGSKPAGVGTFTNSNNSDVVTGVQGKSINGGTTKKGKISNGRISVKKAKNLVTSACICCVIVASGVLSAIGSSYLADIYLDNKHRDTTTQNAISFAIETVKEKLIMNGLATETFNNGEIVFNVNKNNIDDYAKLIDGIDPPKEVVYAYKKVLPDDEFEKLIQSIPYKDENNDLCYYINAAQYYKIHGYINPKYQVSDPTVFDNYMEASYYNFAINGNIHDIINYIINGKETDTITTTTINDNLFEAPYDFTNKGRGK